MAFNSIKSDSWQSSSYPISFDFSLPGAYSTWHKRFYLPSGQQQRLCVPLCEHFLNLTWQVTLLAQTQITLREEGDGLSPKGPLPVPSVLTTAPSLIHCLYLGTPLVLLPNTLPPIYVEAFSVVFYRQDHVP